MKRYFTRTTAIAALSAMAFSAPLSARTLDPSKPEDAVEISKRVQCGEADGSPAIFHWSGKVYSRVQGETDRNLFNVEGMNIRQCVKVTDAKRGTGYRQVAREVTFYLDPETNEIVRTWDNPWTGETVDVMQIANDPVNMRPVFPYSADGKPYSIPNMRQQGKWMLMPLEIPLFYHNVLAGDYQDYVGNKYHAMEVFDFAALTDEILDTDNTTVFPTVSWVRISDWMPWMKMRGRQGQMVFNAMGTKLTNYDDLPDVIKDEIALNHPEYTTPPPADDARPNETTWTVFKQQIDAQRAKEKSGK